jgi:hypothetical protein
MKVNEITGSQNAAENTVNKFEKFLLMKKGHELSEKELTRLTRSELVKKIDDDFEAKDNVSNDVCMHHFVVNSALRILDDSHLYRVDIYRVMGNEKCTSNLLKMATDKFYAALEIDEEAFVDLFHYGSIHSSIVSLNDSLSNAAAEAHSLMTKFEKFKITSELDKASALIENFEHTYGSNELEQIRVKVSNLMKNAW